MRLILSLATVFSAALFVAAPVAHAHGGVFRGPGPTRPPCTCAKLDCSACSGRGLAKLKDVSVRRAKTRVVERWDDLVLVETRVRFETTKSRRLVEGHATVRHAPLFAAVAGRIVMGGEELEAQRKASAAARRAYLRERWRGIDPLLVLRVDAGAVWLRAFPIRADTPTFAVVCGYALSDAIGGKGVRLYRTGTRYLAVASPGALPKDLAVQFVDPGGNRELCFLDEQDARQHFGVKADAAREVPCVEAFEAAVRDEGTAAVTRHTALVAVPPPPPVRTPVDPAPPPPPPTQGGGRTDTGADSQS